jgi:chromosome partitioning protein
MAWRNALEDVNLIWATIGSALVGLTGAFAAGYRLAENRFSQRNEALKRELTRTAAHLRQAERDLAALEPREGPPIGGEPDSGARALDVEDEANLWLRPVTDQLPQATKPILVIANLKGGVAKTMLAANLAAYFSMRGTYPNTAALKNKRVLLIDLDYQGSLSGIILDAMSPPPGAQHPNHRAQSLFTNNSPNDILAWRVHPAANLPRISLYPAEYGFDDFEAREFQKWVAGQQGDIRFKLGETLRSTEFQNAFDLTIIDTGPRLTLGSVSALAAATHLLIPTAPDHRSREAASRFLRRVSELRRSKVCPSIKLVGIAPTLVTAYNQDFLETARADFKAIVAEPDLDWAADGETDVVLNSTLPFSFPIQRAAEQSIPYLATVAIRNTFRAIGAEIEERMTRAS